MPLTYLTVGNSYLVAPYSTIFPTTASIGTVSGTSVQITNITGPPNFTYSIIRNGTTIATGQTGSTYTDSTVAGSTTYTYQIVSTNQYSISNPITIGTVTTPVFIPFSVTGGTITAGTNNYSIATFTGTTGTFTPAVTKTYNYFIAAGGGGGGLQNYGSSGTGGGTAGNGGSGGGGYGVAFYASGTGTPYYVNGITYTTTDVGTAKNGVINTGGGGGGTAGGTPNGVTAGSGGSGICIITGSGVAIPVISNYNFALPVNPTNNTNISCGSVGIGAPGAITLTTNIPSWSFTSGNNVGSLSIFITLGATALATSQLNYPTTNSQFCVLDITGSTVTGTTWVMMYQNLVFTTGTRTLSWYMQNGGNTHANAYFTASIGGISGATQNYTTTNAWVQYSLTFTVITAGTYPIQFTCGVVNNTGAYVVASIGNVVLV